MIVRCHMIKLSPYMFFIFFIMIVDFVTIDARTMRSYVMKKPGEAHPVRGGNRLLNQNEATLEVVDEQVLAQEQFARIKELELEGREPYQEDRKTSITRTY